MSETVDKAFTDDEVEAFVRQSAPQVVATFLHDEQVFVNFTTTSLLVDHPAIVGGSDLGPTPGDLLNASLAACTAIYVGRNCRRLGIPLESVHVGTARELGGEPAGEEGPLAGAGGLVGGDIAFIPKMKKWVEVRGPLTEEHLETIRYLVDHCAIGETLRRGLAIEEEVIHVTDPVPPFGGRIPGRPAPEPA